MTPHYLFVSSFPFIITFQSRICPLHSILFSYLWTFSCVISPTWILFCHLSYFSWLAPLNPLRLSTNDIALPLPAQLNNLTLWSKNTLNRPLIFVFMFVLCLYLLFRLFFTAFLSSCSFFYPQQVQSLIFIVSTILSEMSVVTRFPPKEK